MKKLFPVLATTIAVAAGGAGLYLSQKPGALHGAGKLAAADFLPAQTLVLLALPDPAKSLEDWKSTDLYKIWTEPTVQTFFAKPLSKIPADPKTDSLRAQVAALDPKSLFVALALLDAGNNRPHVVGGFQFKGGKESLEKLLADPKKAYRDGHPAGKGDLVEYQGHAIETFSAPDNADIASTYIGDWYLVSNDPALLKATIDRMEHRGPGEDTSLARDADFKSVNAKLPGDYETLIFGRPQTFLDRMYDYAVSSGQAIDPASREESKKVRAIGATTGFEHGKIRDTLYTYAPGLKQDNAHLAMSSLPLTSPDTLLYIASVLQWPEKMSLPANAGAAAFQQFLDELHSRGITLETLKAALGTEAGLQLTWPAANLQPSLNLSVDVRDHAAAKKLVEQFTAMPVGDAPWQPKQDGAQTYYSLNQTTVSFLQPTLALTEKHLILGLDAPQVRDAVKREGAADAPTFTASETYKAAAALVDKPNVIYAYLDTKSVFERTYGLLRPYALMGSAFLPAQSTEYVDLTKLPEVEVISKHLSPSVLSQVLDKDGIKVDSVGSVTFAQGGTVFGGLIGLSAAAWFAKDNLAQLIPNLMNLAAPVPKAAPAATPEGSPEPDSSPAASPKNDAKSGQ